MSKYNNLSKYEAIEKVEKLRIDSILSYMDNLHATVDTRIKWKNEFIQYLNNDYFDNHNGLRDCADEFNKFYWIPKCRKEKLN
jgi:hypothetical protein